MFGKHPRNTDYRQIEAVGDVDAVRATTIGMKNLGHVSEMLMSATSSRTGDP